MQRAAEDAFLALAMEAPLGPETVPLPCATAVTWARLKLEFPFRIPVFYFFPESRLRPTARRWDSTMRNTRPFHWLAPPVHSGHTC